MTFSSTLMFCCGDITSTPDSLGTLTVLDRHLAHHRGREAAYHSATNFLIKGVRSKMTLAVRIENVREDAVILP